MSPPRLRLPICSHTGTPLCCLLAEQHYLVIACACLPGGKHIDRCKCRPRSRAKCCVDTVQGCGRTSRQTFRRCSALVCVSVAIARGSSWGLRLFSLFRLTRQEASALVSARFFARYSNVSATQSGSFNSKDKYSFTCAITCM